MWLSRQMKAPAPTADADLGMTTITGDSVGVVTRGEVRALPVYGPGGYVWMPESGAAVLVIKGGPGGEEQCVAGQQQALIPEGMGPGEVYLFPRRKQRVPAQRRRDRAAGQSAHPGQPDGERGALCALRELRGDGDGTFPAEWRLCA